MTAGSHRARDPSTVHCAVITVSDTRTPDTDAGGALIRRLLEAGGHTVDHYEILRDDPSTVGQRVRELCGGECAVVLLTGGTGLSPRDSTHEAVVSLLEKRMDGFGELFRVLSFQEMGAAAMLSRAVAGVCGGSAVFSMPGSPAAVRLAMERLILPELAHLVGLLRP
ncbi:MAG: molybdenum cofactor biosynthesis protein MoaB [Planctomycetes bacterium]|nr:molybdenum cofactor biosynthesis protein MoaB [Planctomycetota bacterium]